MEVFTAASLAALVWKFMSVLKDLTGGSPRGAATQVTAWVAGVAAVALASQARVSADLVAFGTTRLGDLDLPSLVLAGVSLASVASVSHDVKRAVDSGDTAAEPPLWKRRN